MRATFVAPLVWAGPSGGGRWLEDAVLADDPAFVAALACGLVALARFHAAMPDLTAVAAPLARLEGALCMGAAGWSVGRCYTRGRRVS